MMKVAAAAKLVEGRFNEEKVKVVARELRQTLGVDPTLVFAFATDDYQRDWSDFSETLRVYGHAPMLVGTLSNGIIGPRYELEENSGFSVLFLYLPATEVTSFKVTNEMVETSPSPEFWHHKTGRTPREVSTWIAITECVQFQVESWLNEWNKAYPGIPVVGGLVHGENKIFLNEESVTGGIMISLGGQTKLHSIVSQGCKPIGNPFTITSVEQNVLHTLGSLPAYQVLNDAFESLSQEEKDRARNNLFAGLAMSEYVEEFKRGDFLVRHILGADPGSGLVAVSALPRVGQTLQYQLRDAVSASEELNLQLDAYKETAPAEGPTAALLFGCAGRGRSFFSKPHHDATMIDNFFPNLPVAGFFGAGEIGPVGIRNYIHGYTASIGMIE